MTPAPTTFVVPPLLEELDALLELATVALVVKLAALVVVVELEYPVGLIVEAVEGPVGLEPGAVILAIASRDMIWGSMESYAPSARVK
jgi:hypothetical protein